MCHNVAVKYVQICWLVLQNCFPCWDLLILDLNYMNIFVSVCCSKHPHSWLQTRDSAAEGQSINSYRTAWLLTTERPFYSTFSLVAVWTTRVTNNMNDGSVAFKCPRTSWQWEGKRSTRRLKGIQPSFILLFNMWFNCGDVSKCLL